VAVDRLALWDAINSYVIACGGDPAEHVYGNAPRMDAVCLVEKAVSNRGEVTEEAGRWMILTDPGGER